MRTSRDIIDATGQTISGYNYDLQCWVREYVVLPCEHPQHSPSCYACNHAGETTQGTAPTRDGRRGG
mgnify:CR=1 FL=1